MATKTKQTTLPDSEVKALAVRVSSLAGDLVVDPQTPTEAASAVAQRNNLKAMAKEVEKTKKGIVNPISEGLTNVRKLFKPIEEKLDKAIEQLTAGLEEFNRRAREAVQAKRERLADRVEDGAITKEKASRVLARTIVEAGSGVVPVRKVKEVVVFDRNLVPNEYYMLDMAKVKKDALEGKAIPGVRVDEVDQVYAT